MCVCECMVCIGMEFSTSHFFEKQLNWTAIHIEADMVNAEQLRGFRGQAINIQAALCDSERVVHFVNRKDDWTKESARKTYYEVIYLCTYVCMYLCMHVFMFICKYYLFFKFCGVHRNDRYLTYYVGIYVVCMLALFNNSNTNSRAVYRLT
jgi:hypothetical protein